MKIASFTFVVMQSTLCMQMYALMAIFIFFFEQ